MRPFYDDYDELDDSSFDGFAATRRLLSEKQHLHHMAGGRKRSRPANRWADDSWDGYDDDYYDDYDEFDSRYGIRIDDE
ncbi:MAG: hypothetical protein KJO95_06105 [Gammaproteobacteria bacterium]|nr:hypothetical protein [Gammaproteobacteria bacterium]